MHRFWVLILEEGLQMQNWLRNLYSIHRSLKAGDWKASVGRDK